VGCSRVWVLTHEGPTYPKIKFCRLILLLKSANLAQLFPTLLNPVSIPFQSRFRARFQKSQSRFALASQFRLFSTSLSLKSPKIGKSPLKSLLNSTQPDHLLLRRLPAIRMTSPILPSHPTILPQSDFRIVFINISFSKPLFYVRILLFTQYNITPVKTPF